MGSTVLHVQDDDKFPLDSNLLATSQWQSIIISNIPNLSPTVATFFLYLFLLFKKNEDHIKAYNKGRFCRLLIFYALTELF